MKRILLLAFIAFTAASAFATDEKDAYCAYIELQAGAQKAFLRTPGIEAGLSQEPISSGVPQMYSGVTNSVSSDFKARQVGRAADKDCALYRATVDAKLRVQFDLMSMQREALLNRVVLEQVAIKKIDDMLANTKPLLDEQNVTVPTIYLLEESKSKMELDIANSQLLIASIIVPPLVQTPLRELVDLKQALEVENQTAQNKVSKEDNWDVALILGIHHSATQPFSQIPSGYGGFRFTYSFGSKSRDAKLDKAALAYGDYKKSQHDDAAYMALMLKQQTVDSIASQEKSLVTLQADEQKIEARLASLPTIETNAAMSFSNQLNLDKLSLGVEVRLAEFRLAQLKSYLQDNF